MCFLLNSTTGFRYSHTVSGFRYSEYAFKCSFYQFVICYYQKNKGNRDVNNFYLT
jgi:hypothetical protein